MAGTSLRPFSIRIFLPDGDPDGLRLIEKSNWTGVGVVFNRATYREASRRNEFSRTGVYILVGAGEESSLPFIYIGEGDPVKSRFESHYANKDFWTWGVFFASKDGSLNKAHVKHLESRLISLALSAKQSNMDNKNEPQMPTLSEAELADSESFLEDMLSIFPLLGLSVFEKPLAKPKSKKNTLYLNAKKVSAEAHEASKGFIVHAGSQAVKEEVPSIHPYMVTLRKDLLSQGVLVESENHFKFTEDYAFKSPSTAAGIILGRSANGRLEWKDNQGRTLIEIQSSRAENSNED